MAEITPTPGQLPMIPSEQGPISRGIHEYVVRRTDAIWKQISLDHPFHPELLQPLNDYHADPAGSVDGLLFDLRNIEDPFHRLIGFVKVEHEQLHLEPKDIAGNYINAVARYCAQYEANRSVFESRIRSRWNDSLSSFITPATVAELYKDPIPFVCDPQMYRKAVPHCVQFSPVMAMAFNHAGIPAAPINYSKDFLPHVGIALMKTNTFLRFPDSDTQSAGNIVFREHPLRMLSHWMSPAKR